MDNVLLVLFTWQFVLFSVAIFGLTLLIRRVVEYFLVNSVWFSKESKIWRDLILPNLPIVLGMVIALIAVGAPYPIDLHGAWGRAAWGLVSGLLSGWVYRLVSAFIGGFITSKTPNADISDPNAVVTPNTTPVQAPNTSPVAQPTDNSTSNNTKS